MTTIKVTIKKENPIVRKINELSEWLGGQDTALGRLIQLFALGVKKLVQFFVTISNRVKQIGFTKTHLKAYASMQYLNFAFFLQGAIGLCSLGLISPKLTSTPTRIHSRNIADLQVMNATKLMQQESQNESDTPAVPLYMQERVKRKQMTQEELDQELDRKFADLN